MTTRPTLAVVVPYHNEEVELPYLLERLRQQTLQPEQVILVNSSSTDNGANIVDAWITSHDGEGRYVNLDARTTTPGGSKTAGINKSSTELVAFMDCGLSFPIDWLERQVATLLTEQTDWVSGVCRTEGTTLVDKAAIAHTYGHRRSRPVIPSSVVRRSVFDRIGTFKDLRAGYDAEWARSAQRAGLRRSINSSVVVEYRGVNFAATIGGVFRKSFRYARPSVGRDDTWTPIVYLASAVLGVVLAATAPMIALFGIFAYASARLVVARRKSEGLAFFAAKPLRLLALVGVGAVMDLGKLLGFTHGLVLRYLLRRRFTH